MEIQIKRTRDSSSAYGIAEQLSDFFDTKGLEQIKSETQSQTMFGAFEREKMLGFVVYKKINSETVEMAWIGISPDVQNQGVGTKLVEESLKEIAHDYKVCEVKTLSEIDPYEPYKKTREFYKKLNFIPIETISSYPGWGDNPCQIFVRFLR